MSVDWLPPAHAPTRAGIKLAIEVVPLTKIEPGTLQSEDRCSLSAEPNQLRLCHIFVICSLLSPFVNLAFTVFLGHCNNIESVFMPVNLSGAFKVLKKFFICGGYISRSPGDAGNHG